MNIRLAEINDYPFLKENDKHIRKDEIKSLIYQHRILLLELDDEIIGWLRWSLFWDNTPFMNMLYILDGHRSQGLGKKLVEFWENQIKQDGYNMVMTSSLSDEQAQHFYRKLGYVDSGSLLLPGEALEIIFTKHFK
ncbi:MAG: GNAT family N-acetyltransferase [Eubacterium sp.]|nr:GNAT family N-acetyltransferase [Eubacterium sp.]